MAVTIGSTRVKAIHVRCKQSELDSIPITDGFIIVCEDTANMYIDSMGTRKPISIAVDIGGGKVENLGQVIEHIAGNTPSVGSSVTVGETEYNVQQGAEIFNDYRDQVYDENGTAIEGNISIGEYSHVEGSANSAIGNYAHSEGHSTVASGTASHAEGTGTIASGDNQHVSGTWNEEDAEKLVIVGNGTSATDRSNAFTLNKDGNAVFAGTVTDGEGNTLNGIASNITTLQEKIDQAIGDSGESIGELSDKVDDLDSHVTDLTSNYDTVSQQLITIDTDYKTMTTRLQEVNNNYIEVNNSYTQMDASLAAIRQSIEDINTRLAGLSFGISEDGQNLIITYPDDVVTTPDTDEVTEPTVDSTDTETSEV